MKNSRFIIIPLLLAISFWSCKKDKKEQVQDISEYPALGALPPDLSWMDTIIYAEELDTTLVPPAYAKITAGPIEIPMPPVQQQGQLNNCSGWATGYALLGGVFGRIEPLTEERIFSPFFVWNQLNERENKGVQLSTSLDLLSKQGSCKFSLMNAGTNYQMQPSQNARENAQNYRLFSFHPFKTYDLSYIKRVILSGYPIPFSMTWYMGFYDDASSSFDFEQNRHILRRKTGEPYGAHAMVICGYDDNIQAFKIMNSHGDKWADKGFCWISYELLGELVQRWGTDLDMYYCYFRPIPTSTSTYTGQVALGPWYSYSFSNFIEPFDGDLRVKNFTITVKSQNDVSHNLPVSTYWSSIDVRYFPSSYTINDGPSEEAANIGITNGHIKVQFPSGYFAGQYSTDGTKIDGEFWLKFKVVEINSGRFKDVQVHTPATLYKQ